MGYLLASATISFLVAFFFVRQSRNGRTWGADSDFDGPQKFHHRVVPRLGGVGMLTALIVSAIIVRWQLPQHGQMALLVACGIPAVAFGLAEDITLSVSPGKRFLAAAVSALLGALVLGAVVTRTDIIGVDTLLTWSVVSVAVTVFAVAGIANSINIIDGFNGLASMVCMMMLAAIGYVAYSVGDPLVLVTALCCIGALAGFFVLNFPRGLIFMGDGGAYFMGFMIAELVILLVHRNDSVSPWFAALLLLYPTVETGFSMYRRRVIKGVSISSPDATHLHSLIFRRLLRSGNGGPNHPSFGNPNAATSVCLWALASISVIPAALFWHSTPALMVFCAVFIGAYLWLYQSIVRFRTPLWMRLRLRLP